eukprot:Transcript_20454.p1 GENE.Transcript_20454~~Transcript_20454.p1  ORF type:complete len:368 (-),score=36.58 Transcript_20454:89-1066(-)
MPAPPGVYAFDDENWRSRAAALPVPEPKAPEPPSGPALLAAATEGDRDGIKFQLDHDVHVDYSSALSAGATALHRAAGCGHIACIDLLVERGANLNAQDPRRKWTPLMFAASYGDEGDAYKRTAIVQRLLAAGADTSLQNANGETALDLARALKYKSCVRLLENPAAAGAAPLGLRHDGRSRCARTRAGARARARARQGLDRPGAAARARAGARAAAAAAAAGRLRRGRHRHGPRAAVEAAAQRPPRPLAQVGRGDGPLRREDARLGRAAGGEARQPEAGAARDGAARVGAPRQGGTGDPRRHAPDRGPSRRRGQRRDLALPSDN